MNEIAIAGYSLLLVFSLYKLADTLKRPVDFAANLLLITGLGALIAYHIRLLRTKKDVKDDTVQRRLRLLAHASLVAFLGITLSPLSAARFQFYDWFALAGHSSLFISVFANLSQLLGVGLLAVYFFFATGRKIGASGMELMNLVGRALLLLFFTVAFGQGAMAEMA